MDRSASHSASQLDTALQALATFLEGRRADILQAWRDAITADPTLTSGASLPRAQLNDHIPALLIDLEQRLASTGREDSVNANEAQRDDAEAHGLHRWQQGFDLSEVTRELGKLNECVVVEFDRYHAERPSLDLEVLATARRIWAHQYSVAICASTSQYFRLQQIEAGGHIRDLEQALESVRLIEQQRAVLWQQAAHDLRGNLGVVANASAGLASRKASDESREKFLNLLDRNVTALHELLDDVTSLARLQGGLEQRALERVDVACLLGELCDGLSGHAQQRSLILRREGPAVLEAESDPVKLRRVAQNLIVNALKYTRQGSVSVIWRDATPDDPERWLLEIADTGPGMRVSAESELVDAIETASEQSKQIADDTAEGIVAHAEGFDAEGAGDGDDRAPSAMNAAPADSTRHNLPAQRAGEGVGLSIVKRLCDMLDAAMEVETAPGVGTTFRIRLPKSY